MTTIVTRASKGVPLTATDNDNNLNNLNDKKVEQTSATGSATLPSGTTAQRDGSPSAGYMRWNSTDGSTEVYDGAGWAGVGEALPTQTGNTGKFLTTDGSATSWGVVDALPAQSGNAGKYLGTDGTDATWNTLDTDANSTTKSLYEMSNTVSADYTISTGANAISAGPITINAGINVTVPSGSTWVIA